MPRRLRSTESSASYVFPIVAVLLCTAGALCTLVYGYDRQGAHVAHVAGVLEESRDEAEELIAQQELLAVRSSHLEDSFKKTQGELALRQAELSHIEDHTRRLRAQAEKLSIAIRELEKQDGSQSREVDVAKEELERLQRAIAAAENELKEKERAHRDRPVTYSVVPYEGPNQTKRRPIYIECRRDSVIIQPEGVVLKDQDFEPPLGPGNPLAAALRAYSEYLSRIGFTGETTRPYPMLLVRPDGIEAYYAARAALQSWGTEFGYELVGDDWKLEFPPVEPRLTSVLEQIVQDARQRQETLVAAAPRQFKRMPTALRASPNGRGFVAEGDSSGRNRYGGAGFSSRSTGRRLGGGGQGAGSGWGDGSAVPGAESGGSVAGGFGDGGNPGQGYGTPNVAAGEGFAAAPGPGGSYSASASGEFGETGGHRYGAPAGEGTGYGTGANQEGAFQSAQAQGTDGRPGGASSATEGRPGARPSSPGSAAEGSPYGSGADPSGSAFGDLRTANAGQPGGTGNEKNQMGTFGTPGQGFQAGRQQPGSAGGADARMGGVPGGAGSPQAGMSGGGQSSQGESQGMPSASAHVAPGKKPTSIANKRGRDWGLPDGSASMVPVTRPIVIRCEPHQLTIVPEDNRMLPQTIPLSERTEASVDKLVSGVWDYMKGWGLAGRGMYWRPTLSLEVAPGAERRFEELQALLQDSGMEVKRRQTATRSR